MAFKTGEIVRGIVSGIQPYGAFVDLGDGVTGLVHISEISDDYVRNIEDYLQIGEESLFFVTHFDEEKKHASLSLKRLQKGKPKRKAPLYRQNKREVESKKDLFTYIKDEISEEVSDLDSDILLTVDKSNILKDIDYKDYQETINNIDSLIRNKTGLGSDYLGWLDYPTNYSDKELLHISRLAEEIRDQNDVFVVCGIGGSYLGARAGIEMIKGQIKEGVEVLFLGNTFSASYTKEVLDYLKDKDFTIDVISKSGRTLETAIAFAFLKDLLVNKYGDDAKDHIIITTNKGSELWNLASKEGYLAFAIPEDIQGRYSVITPVGLLPMAVAGVNVFEFMQGARRAIVDLQASDIEVNPAYQYSLLRWELGKDKPVELLVNYEPRMQQFAEWWKQLFGESEGKENKGILPMSVIYSTDLHSLGQFVQDGSKVLFETVLLFKDKQHLIIPKDKDQAVLSNLSGKDLDDVNMIAAKATIEAHKEGNVPNIVLSFPRKDAFAYGYLVYFFMFAIVTSAYLINVNPCNQEAVEVYKSKMRELLKK